MTLVKSLLLFFIIAALVFSLFKFEQWLDDGCNPNGVVTWHGKVCFNDLTK